MTILIICLASAILLGIAGSITLMLGINGKQTVPIVIGGIMLFFTVLFCSGSIMMSVMHHKKGMHEHMMFYHHMYEMQNHNKWEQHEMKDPSCCKQDPSCCKHDKDSTCCSKEGKKVCPMKK